MELCCIFCAIWVQEMHTLVEGRRHACAACPNKRQALMLSGEYDVGNTFPIWFVSD